MDCEILRQEIFRKEEEENERREEEEAKRREEEKKHEQLTTKQLRETELNKKLSPEEAQHIMKIQKKIDEKIKVESWQEEAAKRVKFAFNHSIKIFECSNGIMMDGSIEDADKLEKAISYYKKKDKKFIIVNDYRNDDHKLSLEDAQKMVDEIQENYYWMLKHQSKNM
jgi:hypothetical protein